MKDEVQTKIADTVKELNEIWDQVEMDEQMRVRRSKLAFENIAQLCNEMTESERNMVKNAETELELYKREICKMRQETGQKQDSSIASLPLTIRNLVELKTQHSNLKKTYSEKLEEQKRLVEQLEMLQFRLGVEDRLLHNENKDTLFRPSLLDMIRTQIAALSASLTERVAEAEELQNELRTFTSLADVVSLTVSSLSTDEDDCQQFLDLNISSDEISLNDDIFNSLKRLHNKMKEIYDEKMDQLEYRWNELLSELSKLWESCLTPEEDREFETKFNAATFAPEQFDQIEAEITRLKEIYSSRQPVYDAIKYWDSLWNSKLALDTKKKDPHYYSSRAAGHSVSKDAQAERNLQNVKLPQAAKHVEEVYAEYLASHADQKIFVYDSKMDPLQYIEYTMNEYDRQQQIETAAKLAAKKVADRDLHSPMKLRTPSKRTLLITPTASGRNSPLVKKPALDASIRMFGSTTSIVSSITPKKPRIKQEDGPKTSSPLGTSSDAKSPSRMMRPPATTPDRRPFRKLQ
ncbi:hypothetical protein WR25_13978 [Diploscapter pachys]|uniref:Protein regulator of cytokinesis 1 n=1 Tax=Diploscapter pachys TaxID=2018661 RepID=A0A2A2M0F9_9BILA|nr:hypothetical protein WR25_13978 [Diploscapter pachys]